VWGPQNWSKVTWRSESTLSVKSKGWQTTGHLSLWFWQKVTSLRQINTALLGKCQKVDCRVASKACLYHHTQISYDTPSVTRNGCELHFYLVHLLYSFPAQGQLCCCRPYTWLSPNTSWSLNWQMRQISLNFENGEILLSLVAQHCEHSYITNYTYKWISWIYMTAALLAKGKTE